MMIGLGLRLRYGIRRLLFYYWVDHNSNNITDHNGNNITDHNSNNIIDHNVNEITDHNGNKIVFRKRRT